MISPTTTPLTNDLTCSYLLRFISLYNRGRGIAVPCDASGKVDIDSLTQRLRMAYLGAEALVGRDYSYPTVQRAQSDASTAGWVTL